MNFSENFKEQWSSLSAYVDSQMIMSVMESGHVNYDDITRLYRNEIIRWNMDGQYQAKWLESLRKSNESVADKFEEELKSFTFSRVDRKSSSRSALYIGGTTAVGAVIGFGITQLIGLSTILTAVGTAVIGIVGFEIGKTVSDKQKKDALDKVCNEYKLQLQAEGEKLLAIVKQADN